jgi:hypothetical protein
LSEGKYGSRIKSRKAKTKLMCNGKERRKQTNKTGKVYSLEYTEIP